MRGVPGISESIFKKAKQITEAKGIPNTKPIIPSGGGAYVSMMKRNVPVVESTPVGDIPSSMTEVKTIKTVDVNKYFDSLFEGLALLKDSKDYSSVVRSLFTYYISGRLEGYLIEGISYEDKKEILGIIKDFENTVKSMIK
jgi:hypothetical protein